MLVVKNLPASGGDISDVGLIPGSGRSPAEGNGNPLQYSCLENPMGRGGWQATVHRVAKSWTQLKRLNMHAWTVACQAPLSMRFSRQEYWSRLHFLFQAIFLIQGSNQHLLCFLHRQAGSLPLSHLGSPFTLSSGNLLWQP